MLGRVHHGFASRLHHGAQVGVQVDVTDANHLDGNAQFVFDLAAGSGQRRLQGFWSGRVGIEPSPQFAFLPAGQGRHLARVFGLPLDQRQCLEYRVVQMRRHVGARVCDELLFPGGLKPAPVTQHPRCGHHPDPGQRETGHPQHHRQLADADLGRRHHRQCGADQAHAQHDAQGRRPFLGAEQRCDPLWDAGRGGAVLDWGIGLQPDQRHTASSQHGRPEDGAGHPQAQRLRKHDQPESDHQHRGDPPDVGMSTRLGGLLAQALMAGCLQPWRLGD